MFLWVDKKWRWEKCPLKPLKHNANAAASWGNLQVRGGFSQQIKAPKFGFWCVGVSMWTRCLSSPYTQQRINVGFSYINAGIECQFRHWRVFHLASKKQQVSLKACSVWNLMWKFLISQSTPAVSEHRLASCTLLMVAQQAVQATSRQIDQCVLSSWRALCPINCIE